MPWDIAAVGAAGLGAITLAVRPRLTTPEPSRSRRASAQSILREVTLLVGLYSLWRLGQQLHGISTTHGVSRALKLWDIQRFLHLPREQLFVDAIVDHKVFAYSANGYYAILHAPAMGAVLVWTIWRHRSFYPTVRNALASVTGICLALHLVAVAPPRLVPQLGFVDVAAKYNQSVYGPIGSGVSDQMGALPSVHVAWAAIVAYAVWRLGSGRWRWLGIVHLLITLVAIVATANHWWLDGYVAGVLVWAAFWVDHRLRAWAAARRASASEPDVLAPPAPVAEPAPSAELVADAS